MKTLKAAKEKTAAAVFATLALCTGFYLVSVCQAGPSFWADPRDKKIIEIGWDALPAAQLLNELPNRQNTSFDGMAFLVPLAGEPDSSICVFDTVQHSPDAYGFDVLQNISKSWGRYTDNLIWVFAIHSKSNRDFDWFDDSQWDRIEANAKNLSKCIKISGAKGIALDPEFYYGVNPWQYSADKFSGKTFDQVSQTVRVRGRQYMRGLQSVKSDVVLYGLELIFGSSRNPNPEGNELALLLPFALGMLDEANPGTVLMDASQVNYHLASTAGASYYYDQIRNVVRSNCIPSDLRDKFDRQYLAAYGLCMDLCYVQGSLAVHTNLSADQQDDFWRNNLYYALRNTDRYVSVYTQFKNTVDQRLNWYTGDFLPANAKAIMSEVRTKINANQSLGFSLNTPEVKIMAPSVSWTAGSNQVAAQASAVFSYQNAPDVSHSDLYLDGLYAGTFNGGTVSINASLMSPGKHQLVLRSFSNGGAETFNDSDILLVDATITKSPAIANTAYSSSIAGSGSNAYGLPITYEKLSGPSWLSVDSDGTLSGTPQTRDSGANLWIVRARNGYGGSDISSLSVIVDPTNNYIGAGTVPNAVPYFLSAPTTKTDLPAGSPITGSLASNAADWEIDGLTFSKTSGPAWLAIAPDGTLSGIPPASARGLNSFVVGIADSAGGTNAGTLQVNVINNAPLPVSQNVNTAWRKPVSINLTGTDADGDALTFAIDSQPGSGVLSGTAPALTYTPGELFSGTDSFTFHVSDGFVNGLIENYNFDLPASPGYYGAEAPGIVDQGGGWTFDNTGGSAGVAAPASYWAPPGGSSPDGGNFAYIAYGGGVFQNISPGEGLITVSFYAVGSTGNPASTNIDISVGGTALKFSGSSVSIGNTAWKLYTSDPINVGAGSQNLIFGRINNAGGGNAQGGVFIDGVSIMRHGTVNIAVGHQNSAPVPISQNVSTAWRTPILINLTGTDADGDTLAFAVDSLPAGGLLSGTAPALTYTPGATFSGTDSFTFHVSDGFEYGLIENYNFDLPASPGYYGAEAPGIVDQGGGWTFDNTGGSAGVAAPASYWAPPGGSSPDGGNFAYIAYGGGVFQNISPGEGLITVSFYAVGSTGNPASTNIDISVGGTALKFSGSSVSIGNTAWKLYTSDPINVGAGSQNLIFGRINNAGGGNAQGGVFIDGVTITRYGTVTIVVGPAPYDAWKQTNFTTQQLAQSSVSGDLSDPDHDGVPNLIEYGLGTDPNKTSMIGLPTLSTTGDYLSLTFTRQKWAADITYRIEATGDLTSSWTEIWSSSSVPYGGGNNASESVTVQDSVSVSSASTHRRFMRLKITKP